ncbi:MAG: 3'(2'),5'-bisphosphate nucleotidase CysQ [Gammaproteobacteria bacterium]|nr:3'(2'),5'-bisphosphate nucleotidase CysQ [Gammaproteobacteria bacterium]
MQAINLLPDCLDCARRAGQAIMEVYAGDFSVQHKDDDSPLTRADLASHHIIADHLHALTPDIPLLSEESAAIDWDTRQRWQRYWLIDPLDGTKEFVKRNGEFTVNIALIEQHRPVLGVVLAPVLNTYWFAVSGAGAQRLQTDSLQDLANMQQAEAIRVRQPPATPPVVIASRSHASAELQQYLQQLPAHEILSVGSSLKFCRVAEGSADLYPRLGPTSEWDTAAAQAVVEQAGGQVLAAAGTALEYNRKASLLNPHFLVIGDHQHDWPQLPPPPQAEPI